MIEISITTPLSAQDMGIVSSIHEESWDKFACFTNHLTKAAQTLVETLTRAAVPLPLFSLARVAAMCPGEDTPGLLSGTIRAALSLSLAIVSPSGSSRHPLLSSEASRNFPTPENKRCNLGTRPGLMGGTGHYVALLKNWLTNKSRKMLL